MLESELLVKVAAAIEVSQIDTGAEVHGKSRRYSVALGLELGPGQSAVVLAQALFELVFKQRVVLVVLENPFLAVDKQRLEKRIVRDVVNDLCVGVGLESVELGELLAREVTV